MGLNDVIILGPFLLNDNATITAALSGVAVATGLLTSWAQEGQVWFGVVEPS